MMWAIRGRKAWAREGVRAALITVAGTTSGNALLLTAVAFGLNWVLSHGLSDSCWAIASETPGLSPS
jgi:hypothetical protein